ncbi:hypothetical protein QBC47DRAFT_435948 [Echria macrotheca]|uniref:C2H2-type domain-containing protein n=1 Tax=Echria macrotheca TaxID=438768 RepID=A0AAJ0BIX2_9PEZI|nr:hypothetical protein QBC47DRAFT_435948 [Echria macrotheca]
MSSHDSLGRHHGRLTARPASFCSDLTPQPGLAADAEGADIPVSDARPFSTEVYEEHPLNTRPQRFSCQSSSKDSGVVMDNDDGSMPPQSYFDFSDDEMNDDGNGETDAIAAWDDQNNERSEAEGTPAEEPSPGEQASTSPSDDLDEDDDEVVTVVQDVLDGEVDKILSFALQLLHGLELANLGQGSKRELCRSLTLDFAETLARVVEDTDDNSSNNYQSASPEPSARAASTGTRGNATEPSDDPSLGATRDGDSVDTSMRPSSGGGADVAVATDSRKRARGENVRLRCPFRAQNQLRFNVRDHPGCSLTSFPCMADLRQHVVKKHRRDDPNKFVCPRCNEVFETRGEQQQHAKRPQSCISKSINHEDGVDGETITRILARNRESSRGEISIEAQWAELWGLVFPDTASEDIPIYTYHVVMEDSDLEAEYRGLLPILADDLLERGYFLHDPSLDMRTVLADNFNMAFQNCRMRAKNMEHTNRQTSNPRAKRPAGALSRYAARSRDSAIGTDTSSVYISMSPRLSHPAPGHSYNLLPTSLRLPSQPPLYPNYGADPNSHQSISPGVAHAGALPTSEQDLAWMGTGFPRPPSDLGLDFIVPVPHAGHGQAPGLHDQHFSPAYTQTMRYDSRRFARQGPAMQVDTSGFGSELGQFAGAGNVQQAPDAEGLGDGYFS